MVTGPILRINVIVTPYLIQHIAVLVVVPLGRGCCCSCFLLLLLLLLLLPVVVLGCRRRSCRRLFILRQHRGALSLQGVTVVFRQSHL